MSLHRNEARTRAFFFYNGCEEEMLYWSFVFFIVGIIAGFLGFGGIASTATGPSQMLFFIFLALSAAALVGSALQGRARRL